MSENEILALFDRWNNALQTGDPQQVASLYETNGILLPTVSNSVRHNPEEVVDYFVQFCSRGPKGKIDEANIRIFGDIAINSGRYTFSFSDRSVVKARFTFVYHWNGQDWKIIEHHSSQMPEQV